MERTTAEAGADNPFLVDVSCFAASGADGSEAPQGVTVGDYWGRDGILRTDDHRIILKKGRIVRRFPVEPTHYHQNDHHHWLYDPAHHRQDIRQPVPGHHAPRHHHHMPMPPHHGLANQAQPLPELPQNLTAISTQIEQLKVAMDAQFHAMDAKLDIIKEKETNLQLEAKLQEIKEKGKLQRMKHLLQDSNQPESTDTDTDLQKTLLSQPSKSEDAKNVTPESRDTDTPDTPTP